MFMQLLNEPEKLNLAVKLYIQHVHTARKIYRPLLDGTVNGQIMQIGSFL